MATKRYVLRKPHRTALWGVFDKQEDCFARTGCITYNQARRACARFNDQNDCAHDAHDHGICIDCGADRTQHFVDAAEYSRDSQLDR